GMSVRASVTVTLVLGILKQVGHVPEFHRVVVTERADVPPVMAPRKSFDGEVVVLAQYANKLAGLQRQETNNAVAAACHDRVRVHDEQSIDGLRMPAEFGGLYVRPLAPPPGVQDTFEAA